MEIGIVGLPRSGKTTVFNALTRGRADTGAYTSSGPNVAVVKVPDPRLDGLEQMFHPKKKTPPEVRYVDIGIAPKGFGKTEGLGGEFFTHMSQSDALLHVVRVFRNDAVPHIQESIDPARDIDALNVELVFSDLAVLEKRLQRLETSIRSSKPHEREALTREQALLARIKEALEADVPIRDLEVAEDEWKLISGFQFLTAKPLLLVANIGEEDLPRARSIEQEWRDRYGNPHVHVAALCGELEMELSQLEDEDAEAFRTSMGVEEAALDRMITVSYGLLGLISFFTFVSEEVRAWSIPKDSTALKAAGKIHSDMERGFIRAEVIGYDNLMECGGLPEAKKRGMVHVEGKNYVVRDGDVITFLFNV
ncbi:MAG: redox-regulated ATPase YchF [Chloroflexota bacterium]|nr:redox-regulated ATPase YchF [Chloroflexota bacterium]